MDFVTEKKEVMLKGHLVQPPCNEQGHLPLDHFAYYPVQPHLQCYQGWAICPLSGKPVPACHHSQCKNFLSYI